MWPDGWWRTDSDCIEVSAGSRASANGMVPSRPNIRREEDEAYLTGLARSFKEAVNVPIITVGGFPVSRASFQGSCRKDWPIM